MVSQVSTRLLDNPCVCPAHFQHVVRCRVSVKYTSSWSFERTMPTSSLGWATAGRLSASTTAVAICVAGDPFVQRA